jgi:hypothetical protein
MSTTCCGQEEGVNLKTAPSTSEGFSLDEFAYYGRAMREPLREKVHAQMEIVRLSGWFQLRFRITSALMR